MNTNHSENQGKTRREVLKSLLVVSGGSLLTLPQQWDKPIVEIGRLPVFAQASPAAGVGATPTPTVSPSPTPGPGNTGIDIEGPLGPCDPGGGAAGHLYTATASFVDPSGGIIPGVAKLQAVFIFLPSEFTEIEEITLGPTDLTGDEFEGTVTIPICIAFGSATSVFFGIRLINASGLVSNILTDEIVNPDLGTPPVSDEPPKGKVLMD